MFVCEYSGKRSEKGQSPVKMVIKVRQKTYSNKIKIRKKVKVKESYGWEIVKEINVLPEFVKEVEQKFGTLEQLISSVVVVQQPEDSLIKDFRR